MSTPVRALLAPLRWLGALLAIVFGRVSWRPPGWLCGVGGIARRRPALSAIAFLAMAGISGGAYWWMHRPRPVDPDAVTFRVSTPDTTDYTQTPPTVDVLTVDFSASAAPLELVDKPARGINLKPPLAGSWAWVGDRRLEFRPQTDWPVAQKYRVEFDTAQAFAPGLRFNRDEFDFTSPPFVVALSSAEFYQDPQDASVKKGVFQITFSHPVEVAAFERLLSFDLADGAGTRQSAPAIAVSYDEHKLTASVQSQALQIPENGGKLTLTVKAGAKSALGGKDSADELTGTVELPSLYSVEVDSILPTLVDNERFEPEQVLVVELNDKVRDQDVAQALKAWVLPDLNPKLKRSEQTTPYYWSRDEVDEALLKKSTPLTLDPLPAEQEYAATHSFKYQAPPGKKIYVRLNKRLKSFGGFLLGENYAVVVKVPAYPELLRFVGDGALLSLKGERRVTVAARNLAGLKLDVARILPGQLQHLVHYNTYGTYKKPDLYNIGLDSLSEHFKHRVALPNDDPAKTHYEGVDLSEYFSTGRHGVFVLSLYRDDPANQEENSDEGSAEEPDDYPAPAPLDQRLVVLTDLGVIVKRALDGSRAVFVQSLSSGAPVAAAEVVVVARNGERLLAAMTDNEGMAQLPGLAGFKHEKEPVLLAISQNGDLSFLPLGSRGEERELNLSRFDIGGEYNAADPGTLSAYLFSDRGLYRPGDTVHLGLIVRAAEWSRSLAGIPLELELTDPRGAVAWRDRIALGATGFESVSHTPAETAPTGTWDASLYLIGADDERTQIGNTTVQVREFLPDRLRVRTRLSSESSDGWVKPEDLRAEVNVENLFGTPAQNRRVTGTLVLQPGFPDFPRYPDYSFYDPRRAKEGYSEELSSATTDAEGKAEFALGLEKYDRATYQLRFMAQAFEAGAGRGVAVQTSVLVSSNEYLVGIKTADSLNYIQRGATRQVQLLAIGADGATRAVEGIHAVVVERRYVSVLTKESYSGLYKYVSQLRKDVRKNEPIVLAKQGLAYALPTEIPGDYVLEIRDAHDTLLNQIDFSVAGAANLTRSLDRHAELQLALSKKTYRSGEDIEISVRAPYPGSGLITIERDRVYAHRWFKADTTSSVQTIRVPDDFDGNGYVNVQFVRDPASSEIFMSPLSYGVAPFAVDRSARRQPLELSTSPLVKPGATASFTLKTGGPARVAVFAVDEGILQVARYQLGDPLDHFLKKKMLQVDTAQILDLILPEFGKLGDLSAPGGDADGLLGKHLNPFKRRGDKPAVYWSGLVDIDGEHTFTYGVPDSFNGKLRVMTVAVSPARIGIAQGETLVRGDFVLSPNVPAQITPGDEVEVSVGVANTVENAPAGKMPIKVGLALPPALTLVGAAEQTVNLAPGEESVARFRLHAGNELGAQRLEFSAQNGKYNARRRIELSLRPSVVYRYDLRIGRIDKATPINDLRDMYGELAKRHAAASNSPLVIAGGLAAYLQDYPHYCTEQLLSQAFPALVLAARPEFGQIFEQVSENRNGGRFAGIIDVLRSRQSSSGGFGRWVATPDPDLFVSAYAGLYLVEAREHDQPMPADLLEAENTYLAELAGDAAVDGLFGLRTRALAVYLLTRQGVTTTNLLTAVHEQLDRDVPKAYGEDAAAMLMAASYQLLKQEAPARQLIKGPLARLNRLTKAGDLPRFADYYDDGIASAWTVYLTAKHFPAQRKRLEATALERLIDPVRQGSNNTLSSALTVLALDALAEADRNVALPQLATIAAQGEPIPFGAASGAVWQGDFSAAARQILVTPAANTSAWYTISQSGFDRKPPVTVQNRGLELIRDYLDGDGKPVTALTVGDEIDVRIRLRALGAKARGSIAVVDLLPGGFELVMQSAPPASDSNGSAAENVAADAAGAEEEASEEFEDDEETGAAETADDNQSSVPPSVIPTLALPGSTLDPEYVDTREDRVVLYATATGDVREFRYRIKATNIGQFVIPPPYAESMYERDIYAQGGPGGTLTVEAP